MLLSVEEIKAQLRLDEDFEADERYLQLLARAVQKRTETYLNRKLYAPDETIPDSDPDGLLLQDDIRLGMLMLISHFYENRSSVTEVENSTCHRALAGLSVHTGTFHNENSSGADQRHIPLPDPGELDQRIVIRRRVDVPADDFGVTPTYPEQIRTWAKSATRCGSLSGVCADRKQGDALFHHPFSPRYHRRS